MTNEKLFRYKIIQEVENEWNNILSREEKKPKLKVRNRLSRENM